MRVQKSVMDHACTPHESVINHASKLVMKKDRDSVMNHVCAKGKNLLRAVEKTQESVTEQLNTDFDMEDDMEEAFCSEIAEADKDLGVERLSHSAPNFLSSREPVKLQHNEKKNMGPCPTHKLT
jgi:hypothetical protein